MLPGDLVRLIRSKAREPGRVWIAVHDPSNDSHDHRATLYYGGEAVCAVPVGDVPRRSLVDYRCVRCHEAHSHPWTCTLGMPPHGFESRAVLHAQPTGQGHDVYPRLLRRGADDILNLCRMWRDEHGQPMLRQGV